jgi:hypothetical protein
MKMDLPLPVWVVTVLLALCAGVVLGSFVPVTRSAASSPVPATPAGSHLLPVDRAEATVPPTAVEAHLGGGEEDVEGLMVGEEWDEGAPVPGWERVAQGPGVIAAGTDTLPSAPLTAVALPGPAPRPGALPREGGRSIIRISESGAAPAVSRRSASADPCAGVIRDADADGCRRSSPRRREAMCPKENDPNYSGPIICIRSSQD